MNRVLASGTLCVGVALAAAGFVYAQQAAPEMSFFITSVGSGKGADLGGLAGADRHCQSLAAAAGAGKKTWRAYLSATPDGGQPAVNARDRIGKGPWYSVEGRLIARNVEELHTVNGINRLVAKDEKGQIVKGRGDQPNTHDILTGSMPDGRASSAKEDTTCGNWTKSGEGSAMVGHHDRIGPGAALLGHHDRAGLRDDDASRSWNSSHPSRACDQASLVATGGAGLFYCFAAN
jgi:hypothetical protein